MTKTDLQQQEFQQFYSMYINIVPNGTELLSLLHEQLSGFEQFIEEIPDEKLNFAYAQDKWTIAQALMHLNDAERIFQYRAFRFSRNDKTSLPGFDQELYINEANSEAYTKNSLLQEYVGVRKATLSLFESLSKEQLLRTGTASDIPWSVTGLGFVICGHQQHHKEIIQNRYL